VCSYHSPTCGIISCYFGWAPLEWGLVLPWCPLPSSCTYLLFLAALDVCPFVPKKKKHNQGLVCHTVALPFTFLKKYLKAKRRINDTQIFHHAKI
jgi:hypothetical protein